MIKFVPMLSHMESFMVLLQVLSSFASFRLFGFTDKLVLTEVFLLSISLQSNLTLLGLSSQIIGQKIVRVSVSVCPAYDAFQRPDFQEIVGRHQIVFKVKIAYIRMFLEADLSLGIRTFSCGGESGSV